MRILCWQARRRFAAAIDGRADAMLERHLTECAACRDRLAGLDRVAALVSELAAAPAPDTTARVASPAFEERVLRLARARAAEAATIGPQRALPSLMRPAPVAAAVALMVAAVALARLFGGVLPPAGTDPDARGVADAGRGAIHAGLDDPLDGVVAPAEVPFVVREDLVGARRGRIPLTTYVLEPAPEEQGGNGRVSGRPVLRASL